MKTKLTLVLFSLLLLTMPSIASDYTLRIFGNANMDDAIDEEDLDLIEAMIGGSEAETELADANHDGLIDEDDLTRVEEIIRGDPTEVTLIDSTERVVKVKTPAERIVPLNMRHATAVIVLGGEDEIVGVDSTVLDRELLFENLSTRALVGSTKEPDIEAILELEPDLVITFTHLAPQDQLDDKLPSEVALVRFDLSRSENLKEEMMALGYLIGNREAVKDYEEWYDLYGGRSGEGLRDPRRGPGQGLHGEGKYRS